MTRRRKILLALAVALVAVAAGGRAMVNDFVVKKIVAALHEDYDVDVKIDDLALSLFSGEATATGVTIEDHGSRVVEIASVRMNATVRDLLDARYDFHEMVVEKPVLHLVVEPGDTTNLARILARKKPSDGPPDFVLFRDGRIDDGHVTLDDAITDPSNPAHFDLTHVAASAAWLQVSGEPKKQEFGDFRVDATLEQKGGPARVTLVGWSLPLHRKPTFAAHAAVTGLDLAQMPQYVSKTTRVAIGGDVMHLKATMRAKDGVIEDGAVVADVPAMKTAIPLKFGGTTSDPVFDEDSKLTAVFHLPFAHLGHIGDVALTTTWGTISDVGTGVIGAGESLFGGAKGTIGAMTRLDPLGALSSAGGGVVGGLKSIGQGILGGVKRLLGGGDTAKDDEETRRKLQVEWRDLHEARRRAMLEAAVESAKDDDKRRARIEKEITATGK